jgi:murein DD-endopeptidase MepM/ murein hydrolase activator NlpD
MGRIIFRACALALVFALGACAGSRDTEILQTQTASARMVWPVPTAHVVTSGYGERGGHGKRADFHKGIDISAPRGTPVLAAASGTVTVAGSAGDYGKYLLLDHGNGTSTLYAHLLEFTVRRSDRVSTGDQIGSVGKTGNATGYHLHFEVRRGTQTTDPRSYLP